MFGSTPTSKSASILVTGALVALFAVATSATLTYARDSRLDDGRDTGRTIAPPPAPAPAPSPAPAPTPPPPAGGITNVTEGSVSSGGNTGGNVTTGDESVEVHVVNVGPTNPPPPPPPPPSAEPPPPPPPAEPECDGRTRVGCGDTERVR